MSNPTPPYIERFREKFCMTTDGMYWAWTSDADVEDVEAFITQELAREGMKVFMESRKEIEKARQEGAEEKMELVRALKEYITFLEKAMSDYVGYLVGQGWKGSEEDYQKGLKLRGKIKELEDPKEDRLTK